jgi:putative ABC transport system substrate-binding protein
MQAFILVADTVLFNYRQQIGVMAIRNRLPATSSLKEFAEAGLLLSYGPDFQPLYRGVAVFIDKIFKGAKPADLPVEQPTKFELVVNPSRPPGRSASTCRPHSSPAPTR